MHGTSGHALHHLRRNLSFARSRRGPRILLHRADRRSRHRPTPRQIRSRRRSRSQLENPVHRDRRSPHEHEGPAVRRASRNKNAGQRLRADPGFLQYKVLPDGVESAFYKLSDPVKQIESMVYNVVLGHVPKMKLDDTFLNQADIAKDLRDNLDGSMKEYGYSIVKVLISDIVPDQKVKAAMNDIN